MKFATLALTALIFSACSSKKKITHEESCDQQWQKVNKKFQAQKYSSARQPLHDFLSTCSGTANAEDAQFALAESHFNLKEWLEAQAEYRDLLNNFPNTTHREKAGYREAFCLSQGILSMDRDQTITQESIDQYQVFLKQHPDSEYADSARVSLDILLRRMADKQIRIANFYKRRKEYQAAVIYLKHALEKFTAGADTNSVFLDLAECYLNMNQLQQAENWLEKLKSLKSGDPLFDPTKKVESEFKDRKSKLSSSKKDS